MKGTVVFDSVYGNTKKVAEAIAEQIRADGHSADILNLGESEAKKVEADFMFVGSPTRMGRPTKKAKAFVEGLNPEYWRNRPIVTFDTVGPMSEDEEKRKAWLARVENSAATRMRDQARARGIKVLSDVLHIAVTGFKGPLAPDALDQARDFTHRFVTSLK